MTAIKLLFFSGAVGAMLGGGVAQSAPTVTSANDTQQPIVDSGKHIEFQFSTKFWMTWNDQKSGARSDGSFWRPLTDGQNGYSNAHLKGFHPVGDFAQPGHADPSGRK